MPDSEHLPSTPGVKLTYDDFVRFPDDGKRHELIDGEHYVTPAPNTGHQRLVGTLCWLIRSYLETSKIGEIFVAPFDIVFTRFDVVEPDLLYMSNERAREILTEKHVTGAPELVVEIASPGTRKRDATIKRKLYERAGVLEYWIVDPDGEIIRLYRRTEDRFASSVELLGAAGDVLRSDRFPGLELPLDRIFSQP